MRHHILKIGKKDIFTIDNKPIVSNEKIERECKYCNLLFINNEPQIYVSGCDYAHEKCYKQFHQNDKNVNHPQHYGGADNIYEAIKIIEHYNFGFCIGNSLKYILRAGKKHPQKYIEDLEKASWYLNRKIESLKKAK